jgi:Ca-activated chloride channel family protein
MSNKPSYTYPIRHIFARVLLVELAFWLAFVGIIALFGYFSEDDTQTHLVFVKGDMFWGLSLLLPLYMFFYYDLRRKNALTQHLTHRVRASIFNPIQPQQTLINFLLFRSFLVFLLLAMTQPSFGTKKENITTKTLELVVCLDVSNSMNTKDMRGGTTRLLSAKRALNQLVNQFTGEKVGICVFAGGAYVQLPMTSDYSAAKLFIDEIETTMFSNQGTNIKAALQTANTMFTKSKTSKGVLLITDGENHEDNPSEIIDSLRQKDITLSILGMGSTNGGPVPNDPLRPELGYKRNSRGQLVMSRMNPDLIRELASKAKGTAAITAEGFPDLKPILTQINRMKRSSGQEQEFEVAQNQYQFPLFASIICGLLLITGTQWLKRSDRQND